MGNALLQRLVDMKSLPVDVAADIVLRGIEEGSLRLHDATEGLHGQLLFAVRCRTDAYLAFV